MKSCNTDFTFSIFTSSQTKLHVKFKLFNSESELFLILSAQIITNFLIHLSGPKSLLYNSCSRNIQALQESFSCHSWSRSQKEQ